MKPYKRDERIADEANKELQEQNMLLCQASGCVNQWSSDFGSGRFCTKHSSSTQPYSGATTSQAKYERLTKLLKSLGQQRNPLDWARKLKQREENGEKLSMIQKESWRKALREFN